jgi:hypothetical protein
MKPKHAMKRIGVGHYVYRGYTIIDDPQFDDADYRWTADSTEIGNGGVDGRTLRSVRRDIDYTLDKQIDATTTDHSGAAGTLCHDDGTGCCGDCGVCLEACDECDGIGYHADACPQIDE